ncbi:hypothetical protein L7F22_047853 [Adiantum nelumboides]|nr:hypothetical protein [Adiantum nelumboides]
MCISTEKEESATRTHYQCLICGAARCKRSLMISHMQKIHPLSPSDFSVVGRDIRVYRCFICGDSRCRLSYLQKHMQEAHSSPLQVLYERKRETEEEENTAGRHYRCLICGASRSKRSLILSHMQGSHPLSPSEFSVVGKDRRVYRCFICGDSRSKPSLLQKHMQVAHPGYLQTHESSVTGDSPPPVPENRKRKGLECEECGRLFKKPSLVQQHSFAHTVQLQYMHQSSTEKGDLSGSPGCTWLMWANNGRGPVYALETAVESLSRGLII